MSQHAHSHDHDHDHHAVNVTADSQRRVFWVMLFTGSYLIVQVIGGLLSGSLALLADAGHMLSDTTALGLAWVAFRLATKPADAKRTFGYGRFQILAAFVNGIALFAIAGWITLEAVSRINNPSPVLATPMLVVAVVGLLVNIIGFIILHRGDKDNVNMRGALLHVVGDLLGSVAAIVAAIVIMATGWTLIDPILAVLVAILVLRSAWDLVKRSGHILLEGAPDGLDPTTIRNELATDIPDVINIHHVHVWAITGEQRIASLHALITKDADHEQVRKELEQRLHTRFKVGHATIQMETTPCDMKKSVCVVASNKECDHAP